MKSMLLLLLFSGFTPGKETVYVCKTTTNATYHAKKDCRNMKTCKQDVLEVSLEEATDQYKKKACKLCYREPDFLLFPSPVIVPLDGLFE
ncbi:MAG: hypothetical protein EOO14_09230 [Chitinophagaceae bacterium]|nr:MAG: hypothetical protein EOO14_09230 [Chitinophagaceae bacterium]